MGMEIATTWLCLSTSVCSRGAFGSIISLKMAGGGRTFIDLKCSIGIAPVSPGGGGLLWLLPPAPHLLNAIRMHLCNSNSAPKDSS